MTRGATWQSCVPDGFSRAGHVEFAERYMPCIAQPCCMRTTGSCGPRPRGGNAAAGEDLVALRAENDQLRRALAGRAVVDQARGMLMVLTPCSRGTARDLLVDISRQCHTKLPGGGRSHGRRLGGQAAAAADAAGCPVGVPRTPGEERAEHRADAQAAFRPPAHAEPVAARPPFGTGGPDRKHGGTTAGFASSGGESVTTYRGGSVRRSIGWRKYALATGLVFALAMITVTRWR